MKKKKLYLWLIVAMSVVIAVVAIVLIIRREKDEKKQVNFRNFKAIKQIQTLRIGILPDEMDYFLDGGKVAGFQYEMLENMASYYGLKTNYIVNKTQWDNLYSLLNNEVDILAMNMPYMLEFDAFVDYTEAHSSSQQLIVQRKNDLFFQNNTQGNLTYIAHDSSCRMLIPYKIDNTMIHLLKDSVFADIALLLTDEKNMNAVFESILQDSADATICDSRYLANQQTIDKYIDYHVIAKKEKQYHWLVYPSNHTLLDSVNVWLKNFKQTKTYNMLVAKYYNPNSKSHKKIINNRSLLKNNYISSYDAHFKNYAQKYRVDWRLLAAIAYQESRFKPSLVGQKGAFGIMQLTTQTSQHFGITEMETISQQIESGAKVLSSFQEKMRKKGIDEENLVCFVIATYNAGVARVEDAMKIAEIQKKDATQWKNVKESLLDLNNNEIRKLTYLKTGKYNAKHTLKYVDEVYMRYVHYCNLVE
ncbi:MAG: transglycosylase SLT domain-containing protein [Bacteroidales bacterium]|nr:transglycosylase SLT domain-containing protein [Bacteroidales bacterium]